MWERFHRDLLSALSRWNRSHKRQLPPNLKHRSLTAHIRQKRNCVSTRQRDASFDRNAFIGAKHIEVRNR